MCARRVAQHVSTIEEDERILGEDDVSSRLTVNQRHAVIVRREEKVTLQRWCSVVMRTSDFLASPQAEEEFRALLLYVAHYLDLWDLFACADSSGDRRMSFEEFQAVLPWLQERGAGSHPEVAADPLAAFQKIDRNGGGVVLFDEFCSWATKQAVELPAAEKAKVMERKIRDIERKLRGRSLSSAETAQVLGRLQQLQAEMEAL